MTALVAHTEVFEGADGWNDGAVVIRSNNSDDGVLLVTTDVVGSILLDIFEEETSSTAIYSASLAAASVISNSPVPWSKNQIGRNFSHRVRQVDLAASSVTLKGGRRYKMVYRITTNNDGELRLVFVWHIVSLPV